MRTMERVLSVLLLSSVFAAACAPSQSQAPAPVAPPVVQGAAPVVFDYVGGLALRANDPKVLAQWYTERFGLNMSFDFPGGVAGGFKADNTNFNMAIVRADGKHPGSARGTAYFVLHVRDFDRFLADAAARGITPFERTSDAMGRFASFRDPEGNEVGVWGA